MWNHKDQTVFLLQGMRTLSQHSTVHSIHSTQYSASTVHHTLHTPHHIRHATQHTVHITLHITSRHYSSTLTINSRLCYRKLHAKTGGLITISIGFRSARASPAGCCPKRAAAVLGHSKQADSHRTVCGTVM